jgi:hypothetical protein
VLLRSNKPAVGHNCLFDVSYGLYGFADSFLPSTWRDFKKMVRSWHPGGIWDTKYIARQLPEVRRELAHCCLCSELCCTKAQAAQVQELLMQMGCAVSLVFSGAKENRLVWRTKCRAWHCCCGP